jgi:hypothetical protein
MFKISTELKSFYFGNLLKIPFPSPPVKNNNFEKHACLLCVPNRVAAFVAPFQGYFEE